MDKKSLCRVNVLGHDLYLPSQTFLLHHKTWCPRFIMKDKKYLVSLWTWFFFFGVITEDFIFNDSNRSKTCFPNSSFCRYFIFCCCKVLFQCNPIFFIIIFQYIPRKMFLLDLPSLTPLFVNFLQDNPQNAPNMDVW